MEMTQLPEDLTPHQRVERLIKAQAAKLDDTTDQYKAAQELLARIPMTVDTAVNDSLWWLSERKIIAAWIENEARPILETKALIRSNLAGLLPDLVEQVISRAEQL